MLKPMRPLAVSALVAVNFLSFELAQQINGLEQIVSKEAIALAEGNGSALLALFSPDAVVFEVSETPDRLAGPPSATMGTHEQRQVFVQALSARGPRSRREILETVVVGDLIAVTMRSSAAPDDTKSDHTLSVYRVRDGRVGDCWRLAEAQGPSGDGGIITAIRQFVDANNQGDAEAFLAHFSPDAKVFRPSDAAHGLADKLSERMSQLESRRTIITAVFAKGSPGQAQIVDILALGDLVVSHDRVTLPSGQVVNQMKIYRVRRGLITHDWTAYERPQ